MKRMMSRRIVAGFIVLVGKRQQARKKALRLLGWKSGKRVWELK